VDLLDNARLSLCVGNQGRATAGPFEITVETLARWEIQSLDVDAQACFSTPLQTTARVLIDPSDEVREYDESDNSRLIVWPTLTRGPACTPTPTP
jgi:hypothetical protein